MIWNSNLKNKVACSLRTRIKFRDGILLLDRKQMSLMASFRTGPWVSNTTYTSMRFCNRLPTANISFVSQIRKRSKHWLKLVWILKLSCRILTIPISKSWFRKWAPICQSFLKSYAESQSWNKWKSANMILDEICIESRYLLWIIK